MSIETVLVAVRSEQPGGGVESELVVVEQDAGRVVFRLDDGGVLSLDAGELASALGRAA